MEGTIHSSNTLHHRVQSLFHVSTDALHIVLSVSIVRSGEIMIIIAQKPHDTGRQITQDKIWQKLAGVSHKAVVALQ